MKSKPEDKHFKQSGKVIQGISSSQRKGSGKKIGAPTLVEVRENAEKQEQKLD